MNKKIHFYTDVHIYDIRDLLCGVVLDLGKCMSFNLISNFQILPPCFIFESRNYHAERVKKNTYT